MINKTLRFLVVLILFGVIVAAAATTAPTSYSKGYKLYGTWWDFMGDMGIKNGTIANTTFSGNMNIPTVRPSSPINGTIALNLTNNAIEIYSNGGWRYPENGTVK